MRLTKIRVIFSVLIARTCLSGIIIESSNQQQSGLIKNTVNILKDCYVNRVTTVGIAGNAGGAISEPSWFRELIPVTLIDKTQRIVSHGPTHVGSRHKLQFFVVIATSSSTLSETLKAIKESRWWNHMASFLIVDWSIPGCSKRFELLWTAWEMDLLASNFLCLHETKGWLIYTYNPYTSKAPNPWNLENTYRGKNDHTWTLFVRKYQEAEDICNELDFDKVSDLGGYMIRTSVANTTKSFVDINPQKNGTDRLSGLHVEIAWTLYRALNATPFCLESTHGKDGVAHVTNGIGDFGLNARYNFHFENFTTSYPFLYSGLRIVTQTRGKLSQLVKIVSVIDRYSRLGVCLVCLITVLFFSCFLRYSLSSAILNILLLICNAALRKIPENLAARIYLATIFIFVLNIQGIYQGKLASLMTGQINVPRIRNLQDLSKFGYTLYGPEEYARIIKEIKKISPNVDDCLDHVVKNPKAACINEKNLILMNNLTSVHLQIGKKRILRLHWVYMMRKNWPPERRVNAILARLVESRIIQVMFDRGVGKKIRNRKITKAFIKRINKRYKVIQLAELRFAFVILAVGLVCATICFVVEVGIKRVSIGVARHNLRKDKFFYPRTRY